MSSKKFYLQKPFFDRDVLSKDDEKNEINYYKEFYNDLNKEFFDEDLNDFEYQMHLYHSNRDAYYDFDFFREGLAYTDEYVDSVDEDYIRVNDLIAFEKAWIRITKLTDANTLSIYYSPFFLFEYDLTDILLKLMESNNGFIVKIENIDKDEKLDANLNGRESLVGEHFAYKMLLINQNQELLENIRFCLTNFLIKNFNYLYDKREKGLISRKYLDDLDLNYNHLDLLNEAKSIIRLRDLKKEIKLLNINKEDVALLKRKI